MNTLIVHAIITGAFYHQQAFSTPEWTDSCGLDISNPHVSYANTLGFYDNYVLAVDLAAKTICRRRCSDDVKCGMYLFTEVDGVPTCSRASVTLALLSDSGISIAHDNLSRGHGQTLGIKRCSVRVDRKCREVNGDNSRQISYIILDATYSDESPVEQCRRFCELYSECKSYSLRQDQGLPNCSIWNYVKSQSTDIGTVYNRSCELKSSTTPPPTATYITSSRDVHVSAGAGVMSTSSTSRTTATTWTTIKSSIAGTTPRTTKTPSTSTSSSPLGSPSDEVTSTRAVKLSEVDIIITVSSILGVLIIVVIIILLVMCIPQYGRNTADPSANPPFPGNERFDGNHHEYIVPDDLKPPAGGYSPVVGRPLPADDIPPELPPRPPSLTPLSLSISTRSSSSCTDTGMTPLVLRRRVENAEDLAGYERPHSPTPSHTYSTL